MAAPDIVVRPIRADERTEWEPLWKGYQPFHLKNNLLLSCDFFDWRPHLPLRCGNRCSLRVR